jgi:hypothetical protein
VLGRSSQGGQPGEDPLGTYLGSFETFRSNQATWGLSIVVRAGSEPATRPAYGGLARAIQNKAPMAAMVAMAMTLPARLTSGGKG